MKIISDDPLRIDTAVFLSDAPNGRARKFMPGEDIPDHCAEMIRKRVSGEPFEPAQADGDEPNAAGVPSSNDDQSNDETQIIALTIDVGEATVSDIEEYLEANPSHALTVMEAEEIASGGEPRKGVAAAVAEVLGA